MKDRFSEIIQGWLFWRIIKTRYKISYKAVVLVLTGSDKAIDSACMTYLNFFIGRKHAEKAIIFCLEEKEKELHDIVDNNSYVKISSMSEKDMKLLFSFYSFVKFFDNIVFTYTEQPKDNYLGRYLRETDITPEDAACLALYHLRYVPSEI